MDWSVNYPYMWKDTWRRLLENYEVCQLRKLTSMNLLDLNILVPFMRKRNHRRAARRPKTQRRVRAVILPKKQKSKNKTTICERVQPNWVFSWTEYHSLLFLQTSIPKEDILKKKGLEKKLWTLCMSQREEFFPMIVAQGFLGTINTFRFTLVRKSRSHHHHQHRSSTPGS